MVTAFIITKQLITNNLTNYITKLNSITNNVHVLNIKKDFSTKHYITHVFRSNNKYTKTNLHKTYDNIIFNNTNNITNRINNYVNGITHN